MLTKSLIQLSVVGRGCVPFLLFDLRLNYGGVKEDNGDLLPKVQQTTQCPQICSRLPPSHTSARDSWILAGKSGSVSCGVTVHFSWVLVHTRFCLCPARVCLSITNSWSLLKLMSIESVMPSNHLIFCHPLLLPSIQDPIPLLISTVSTPLIFCL